MKGKLLPSLVAVLLAFAGNASAQITVRGKLAHDLDAVAGQRITGSVMVDNESQEVQQAKVYLRDYMFYADGSNEYAEPGSESRSSGLWVRFSPETMSIPPQSSVTIDYEIIVPESAGPGTFWSMLMVEGVDATSDESTTGNESQNQVGFRQVTRYGVQLAVHLREAAEKNVAFDNIQLVVDEEGKTFFRADVTNSGTLMLHPNVYMRVFDAEGTEFGPFEGSQFRMYPGTSVRQRIDLSSLSTGTYQALLIVDNGDDAVFGGQYELTL